MSSRCLIGRVAVCKTFLRKENKNKALFTLPNPSVSPYPCFAVSEEVFCLVWYEWRAKVFSRCLKRAAPAGPQSLYVFYSFAARWEVVGQTIQHGIKMWRKDFLDCLEGHLLFTEHIYNKYVRYTDLPFDPSVSPSLHSRASALVTSLLFCNQHIRYDHITFAVRYRKFNILCIMQLFKKHYTYRL